MDKNINMQVNQFSENGRKKFVNNVFFALLIIRIFSLVCGKDNENMGWKVVEKVNSLKKLRSYVYFNSVLIYSSLVI